MDEPPTWTRHPRLPYGRLPAIHFETELPPGVAVIIEVQCETSALYNRFVVDTPEDFEVSRLEVAGEPQLAVDPSIPGAMLTEDFRLDIHTRRGAGIYEGMVVGVTVRNVGFASRPFHARVTVAPEPS